MTMLSLSVDAADYGGVTGAISEVLGSDDARDLPAEGERILFCTREALDAIRDELESARRPVSMFERVEDRHVLEWFMRNGGTYLKVSRTFRDPRVRWDSGKPTPDCEAVITNWENG